MKDEEFLKITDSLSAKLGKEQSAVIADDLGLLITANAEVQKSIRDKDAEIQKLREDKEKLVAANSNLLRQVPMGMEAPKIVPSQRPEKANSHFSFKDAFDDNGNFKK